MVDGEFEWSYVVPFEKAMKGSDGRRIIVGHASSDSVDRDGEIVDQDSLAKAASDYIKMGGIVKFMHDKTPLWKGACGKVIPEYTADDGTVYKTVLGKKPFLVIEFTKSAAADHIWTMIEEGLYKGLSIGGGALKKVREIVKGTGQVAQRLFVSRWGETSIVDIPSNPDGLFTVIKSFSDTNEVNDVKYIESEEVEKFISAVDDFLKGGPGSGIKGHHTDDQYRFLSSDAMKKASTKDLTEERDMLLAEGQRMISEAHIEMLGKPNAITGDYRMSHLKEKDGRNRLAKAKEMTAELESRKKTGVR